MSTKIKVLVIDDSALIRQILTKIINSDPELEVVGTAVDPIAARDKIKALNPDVLTLDIEMPRMDGITFLRNLMRLHPMPVVMISTLTSTGADVTLEALELGAVDFISKPKLDVGEQLQVYSYEIINKVKTAASAKIRARVKKPVPKVAEKLTVDAIIPKRSPARHSRISESFFALGASTGGTEAIKEVLLRMPADAPGIVISQHIPEAFSGPFAKRMDSICKMTVHHAVDGQQILPGNVYIAPGSHHLLVEKSGSRFICRLNDGPLVNRHKPSVDVMFRSVVQAAGANATGVMLTGMGADGALGMKEMHDAGAVTIAQDEESSVVWGMPGSAVEMGGVDHIVTLEKIAEKMLEVCVRAR